MGSSDNAFIATNLIYIDGEVGARQNVTNVSDDNIVLDDSKSGIRLKPAGSVGSSVPTPSDAIERAAVSPFADKMTVDPTKDYIYDGQVVMVRNLTNRIVIVEEVGRHRGSGIKVKPSATNVPILTSAWESLENNFAGILARM